MASAAADFVAGREVRLGDLYDEAATLIVGAAATLWLLRQLPAVLGPSTLAGAAALVGAGAAAGALAVLGALVLLLLAVTRPHRGQPAALVPHPVQDSGTPPPVHNPHAAMHGAMPPRQGEQNRSQISCTPSPLGSRQCSTAAPPLPAMHGVYEGALWSVPGSAWRPGDALAAFPPDTDGPGAVASRWHARCCNGVLTLIREAGGAAGAPRSAQIDLNGCSVEAVGATGPRGCAKGPWWRKAPLHLRVATAAAGAAGAAGADPGVPATTAMLYPGQGSVWLFAASAPAKEQWAAALSWASGGDSHAAAAALAAEHSVYEASARAALTAALRGAEAAVPPGSQQWRLYNQCNPVNQQQRPQHEEDQQQQQQQQQQQRAESASGSECFVGLQHNAPATAGSPAPSPSKSSLAPSSTTTLTPRVVQVETQPVGRLLPDTSASLAGANALLSRLVFELLRSDAAEAWLTELLQHWLDDIRRPPYLQRARITALDLGCAPPLLTGIHAAEPGPAGSTHSPQVAVSFAYSGRVRVGVSANVDLQRCADGDRVLAAAAADAADASSSMMKRACSDAPCVQGPGARVHTLRALSTSAAMLNWLTELPAMVWGHLQGRGGGAAPADAQPSGMGAATTPPGVITKGKMTAALEADDSGSAVAVAAEDQVCKAAADIATAAAAERGLCQEQQHSNVLMSGLVGGRAAPLAAPVTGGVAGGRDAASAFPPCSDEGSNKSNSAGLLRMLSLSARRATEQALMQALGSMPTRLRHIPVQLEVQVTELRGELLAWLPPPPSDRLWLSFSAPPQVRLSVSPVVAGRTLHHPALASGVCAWLEDRVLRSLQGGCVMPAATDIPLAALLAGTALSGTRDSGGARSDDGAGCSSGRAVPRCPTSAIKTSSSSAAARFSQHIAAHVAAAAAAAAANALDVAADVAAEATRGSTRDSLMSESTHHDSDSISKISRSGTVSSLSTLGANVDAPYGQCHQESHGHEPQAAIGAAAINVTGTSPAQPVARRSPQRAVALPTSAGSPVVASAAVSLYAAAAVSLHAAAAAAAVAHSPLLSTAAANVAEAPPTVVTPPSEMDHLQQPLLAPCRSPILPADAGAGPLLRRPRGGGCRSAAAAAAALSAAFPPLISPSTNTGVSAAWGASLAPKIEPCSSHAGPLPPATPLERASSSCIIEAGRDDGARPSCCTPLVGQSSSAADLLTTGSRPAGLHGGDSEEEAALLQGGDSEEEAALLHGGGVPSADTLLSSSSSVDEQDPGAVSAGRLCSAGTAGGGGSSRRYGGRCSTLAGTSAQLDGVQFRQPLWHISPQHSPSAQHIRLPGGEYNSDNSGVEGGVDGRVDGGVDGGGGGDWGVIRRLAWRPR